MKIGDTVKSKHDGTIGKVVYSSFGVSIHWRDEKGLHKTLGDSVNNVKEYWEVVESDGQK